MASDGFDCAAADVAIVDYSFDGSDRTGVDVISYLKKMGMKEIHMCTGYADDDAVRKAAFDAGADSVINKDLQIIGRITHAELFVADGAL